MNAAAPVVFEPGLVMGYTLCLIRASGLFVAAPILSGAQVPARVRVIMALAVGTAGFSFAGMPHAVPSGKILAVTLLAEVFLTIVVGLACRFALDSASAAGSAIAISMGLGFGSMVDPSSQQAGSSVGALVSMLALGFAVALGLHKDLIVWFCMSIRAWPPGQILQFSEVVRFAILEGIGAFTLAARLAFPVLAAVTLSHVVLGLVGRFAPQLNLSSLGFSVSILAGGGALYLVAPSVGELAARSASLVLTRLMG